MVEKRRYHRVQFSAPVVFAHLDMVYGGRLENLSLNGALVSFDDGIVVPQGDAGILVIGSDGADDQIRIGIEVVHSHFTMIGMRFVSMDREAQSRLYSLLERVSSEPERLKEEFRLVEAQRR